MIEWHRILDKVLTVGIDREDRTGTGTISLFGETCIFDNSNNYVLVYNGGKNFRVQKVDLYKTIANRAYIRSGLKEGDHIITANQLLIYNALTNN